MNLSNLNDRSKKSIIHHADPHFYTRVFSPIYNVLTSITGWQNHIKKHALEGIKPARLLDVGCGTGHLIAMAKQKGFDVVGLDASDGMRKKALEKYKLSNNDYILASATDIPFESESFDVIITTGCLVHVPDISLAAKEIARVLKPGGVLRIIDHLQPKKTYLTTPFFTLFSHLSGDILHDYEAYFEELLKLNSISTLGRGGYLQKLDFIKAS